MSPECLTYCSTRTDKADFLGLFRALLQVLMDASPAAGTFITALSCVDSPVHNKACARSAAFPFNLGNLQVSVVLVATCFHKTCRNLIVIETCIRVPGLTTN